MTGEKSWKKYGIIGGLIILIAAVFFYHLFLNTPKPSAESSSDKKNYATITIKDGAGAADTNHGVNGLHVYDPRSKDLEDFGDGAEVELGTKLSIFAYNRASEVHLKITHNGKVIADKDYPILQSDNDVEFFEFIVEGC